MTVKTVLAQTHLIQWRQVLGEAWNLRLAWLQPILFYMPTLLWGAFEATELWKHTEVRSLSPVFSFLSTTFLLVPLCLAHFFQMTPKQRLVVKSWITHRSPVVQQRWMSGPQEHRCSPEASSPADSCRGGCGGHPQAKVLESGRRQCPRLGLLCRTAVGGCAFLVSGG